MKQWLVAREYISTLKHWEMNGTGFLSRLLRSHGEPLDSNLIPHRVQQTIRFFLERDRKSDNQHLVSVAAAFDTDYVKTDSLSALKDKIGKVSAAKDHYPSFAVFQASGYWKSRLVVENAKINHFTLYWCLRRSSSSGYPKRSEKVVSQLKHMLLVS